MYRKATTRVTFHQSSLTSFEIITQLKIKKKFIVSYKTENNQNRPGTNENSPGTGQKPTWNQPELRKNQPKLVSVCVHLYSPISAALM